MTFSQFFKNVTDGMNPYPWQKRFANWDSDCVAVVTAPTGVGKQLGAELPWLYSYKIGQPATTRLVYALPTRSLVDQVYLTTVEIVEKLGLPIKVYCLKGGKLEHGFEQNLTQPAILIGTQDQLLSRALNRGFGVSWGQKPLHCAALNNDCRWILDEVQLTGPAYWTLVQLYQQWKESGTYGQTQLCLMSATFDDTPLKGLPVERFELDTDDLVDPFLGKKVLRIKPLYRQEVADINAIADLVRSKHRVGQLSLVVMNQVSRVRGLGELLSDLEPLVIHSRFLGIDREKIQERLRGYQGLIISTQVVEAGVDLDADLLITELCPWSSFVQRCGRCGRTRIDNSVEVYWLDWLEQAKWNARPYENRECDETRDRLLNLTDVSLHNLGAIALPPQELPRYPLSRKEMETFFKTHPRNRDGYNSVSQYVRDTKGHTVSVVWSERPPERLPHQRYLCPVPTHEIHRFCEDNTIEFKVWGWKQDGWQEWFEKLTAGDIVWLPLDAGGYSHQIGWTGNVADKPTAYPIKTEPQYDDPPFPHKLLLGRHLKDTEDSFRAFIPHLETLGLPVDLLEELARCARWHDWGKAHPVWQAYANAPPGGGLLAKSQRYGSYRQMGGFRHELASALAAGQHGAPFLAQYLIAAHHGKVRDSLRPLHSKEEFNPRILRGVELGTSLPEVAIEEAETLPSIELNFTGRTRQWDKQLKTLLREYGVFRLIYLEALIRNADIEASRYREEVARNGCL